MSASLLVATFNLRALFDRWAERLPLILADMAALQPDVLGLQEVVYPMEQDRVIGSAGTTRYEIHRAWAGRPEYGNAVLIREGLGAGPAERLELGYQRSALRVGVRPPGGPILAFTVVHLHHLAPDAALRDAQAAALLDWLDAGRGAEAEVVVGDFNAPPGEPAHERMLGAGFRSAFAAANGAEPAVTWPSGLQAPGMDAEGSPGCLDYVWVRGAVEVGSARLVFDRPAVGDPTLYPSDHFGVAAALRFG